MSVLLPNCIVTESHTVNTESNDKLSIVNKCNDTKQC